VITEEEEEEEEEEVHLKARCGLILQIQLAFTCRD
jgi:hypothetical protein